MKENTKVEDAMKAEKNTKEEDAIKIKEDVKKEYDNILRFS